MTHTPLRAGVLGTGTIAVAPGGFLPGMMAMKQLVEVRAVADPVVDRAQEVASRFDIPQVYSSLEDMLERADIDLVLNLTPIPIHGSTSKLILEAGKHLLVEKPIATTMEEADELIALAQRNNLKYVVAPPDMLYSPQQEVKRLMDERVLGQPCFARVRSSHGGPAAGAWPLDPTWFYQKGSGPLFDMGVYGIHSITGILGPAKRVVGFSGITEPVRTVRGGPYKGKKIEVTADDNTLFMLDFGNSVFAVIDGTFNVNASRSPRYEIFCREGTVNINQSWEKLDAPPVEIFKLDLVPGVDGWVEPRTRKTDADRDVDLYHRAVMVKHLAQCINEDKHPVLSAEHARHALEIMLKAIESSRNGRVMDLETTF
jgi:predicted dehydrogenase